MNYTEIIRHVSSKTGIPEKVVKVAYESYWKFIRTKITELPLKDNLSEEEFNKLRTNFNIPSIGKLACTYSRYKALKSQYIHLMDIKKCYDC